VCTLPSISAPLLVLRLSPGCEPELPYRTDVPVADEGGGGGGVAGDNIVRLKNISHAEITVHGKAIGKKHSTERNDVAREVLGSNLGRDIWCPD
jgi:hypothetical protein